MSRAPRWLIPLCVASLLWAFSFGLSAPLASLWMQDAGCSNTLIGLNTGAYYLGIALAAGAAPWLMRRWGYRVLILGMVASGLAVAAFPWGGGVFGWFAWRGVNGIAAALSLIPLETLVNHHSAPHRRAQNFGTYAFCFASGMALGTLVGLQMYAGWSTFAFAIGGTAALLAGGVVVVWQPAMPSANDDEVRPPLDFARNLLAFGSAWSQGFLEGGMIALLPIYLLAVGLSPSAVSWLMGGLMIGVIGAQAPVAWLADRLGRRRILLGCNLVTLLGIGCLMLPVGTSWLAVWLFVVGACSGAFYPMGLAVLGERTPPASLARANAWFLAINCAGSLTGPAVAGAAMDWFGDGALFAAGGTAVTLVLVVWILVETRHATAMRAANVERVEPKQRSLPPAA
jgi:MFS family permease